MMNLPHTYGCNCGPCRYRDGRVKPQQKIVQELCWCRKTGDAQVIAEKFTGRPTQIRLVATEPGE